MELNFPFYVSSHSFEELEMSEEVVQKQVAEDRLEAKGGRAGLGGSQPWPQKGQWSHRSYSLVGSKAVIPA